MALRKNWTKIDKHASQAKDADSKTFQKLVTYLDQPIKNSPDRDIYMTRALIIWWYYNESKVKGQTGSDSPLALLKEAKERTTPSACAFQKLCEKANVTCEVVTGICKSGSYEPGDTDEEKLYGSWNKVWLQGSWWPVYPRWIICTIAGVVRDDYKQIESTGHAKAGTGTSSHGQTLNQFNDFWFLTDPQIFINKCYPENAEDQMLPQSKRVKTKRKFLKLPYYTLNFFRADLRLTSDDSCIVDTEDGVGRVSFRADRIKAKHLVFEYDLYIKETEEESGRADDASSPKMEEDRHVDDVGPSKRTELPSGRLVLNTRRKGNFIFEVRCPVEGIYKLDIRGGKSTANKLNIYMKSTIRCREKVDSIRPLPVEVGGVGFGVGPQAIECGLSKPSVPTPKVCFVPGKPTTFTFKTEKGPNTRIYTAELFGKVDTSTDLTNCVTTTTESRKRELAISVTVPGDGEYVLRIYCAESSTQKARAVCNYLLTSQEDKEEVDEEYYDSSDGFSEDDEEIETLANTVKSLEEKRDELLKILAKKTGVHNTETLYSREA